MSKSIAVEFLERITLWYLHDIIQQRRHRFVIFFNIIVLPIEAFVHQSAVKSALKSDSLSCTSRLKFAPMSKRLVQTSGSLDEEGQV
jgi:hypothetical protein